MYKFGTSMQLRYLGRLIKSHTSTDKVGIAEHNLLPDHTDMWSLGTSITRPAFCFGKIAYCALKAVLQIHV